MTDDYKKDRDHWHKLYWDLYNAEPTIRYQLNQAKLTITELRKQNGILSQRYNGLIAQRASETKD